MRIQDFGGFSVASAGTIYTAALATGAAVSLPAVAVAGVSSTVALLATRIFTRYAFHLIIETFDIYDETYELIIGEVSLATFETTSAVAVGTLFGLGAAPIGLIAASGFIGINVYVISLSLLS